MTSRISLLLLIALLGGCAWGYAGKESKPAEPQAKPADSGVVVVKLKKRDQPDADNKPISESPCGVDAFTISQFSDETITSHTIDCQLRVVVDSSSASLTQPSISLVTAGYPKGKWYVVVDPSGESEEISNTVLLKLSREFEIEFYGRDTASGLLVYLFLDDVNTPN